LGKHKKELKAARQGRKQYPDNLYALYYEANALAALGRMEELNELFDESLTLPQKGWSHGWMLSNISKELRAHGYREEAFDLLYRASEWFEENLGDDKTSESYRVAQAVVHYRSERWDEAQTYYESLYQEYLDEWSYQACLGYLAAIRGDVEEALRISEELKNLDVPFIWGYNTSARAGIAALLGDKEQAVTLLREAISQGVTYPSLHASMILESLLDYPPYKELIKPKKK
jgi:tetratricopeptide (TPR) repeat protein